MPPQQPSYGSPTSSPQSYDFIVNYGSRPPSRFSLGSSSTQRIAMVAGGGGLLLVIAIAFIVFLSSASSTKTAPLIALVEQQAEMARVAQLVSQDPSAVTATQNLAINMQLGIFSEQQAFLQFLKARGTVPDQKTVAIGTNHQTDTSLQTAKTNGNYDTTYVSIARGELTIYEQSLSRAFSATTNLREQQLLKTAYTQAQLLTKQSQQSA